MVDTYKRIPRKLKKKIPKNTPYCYTPIEFPSKENNFVYKVKPCHFYTHKNYEDMSPRPSWIDEGVLAEIAGGWNGWCKLIKEEVDDQCKSCGLKLGF